MPANSGIPFGNYLLLRRVARGGMAEVFLAQQKGLEGFGRRVAVKRILPHLVDSREFVDMFLSEARLAAQLTHPNIVHIYDFGKNGSDYFIAMEFVDGVHAAAIVDKTATSPLPWGLLARIGADCASALHYAHNITDDKGRKLGLVHRDVSPANIIVSKGGSAKLVDFGIAKAVALSDQRTSPGMVKGKYTYMSPEQTTGSQLDGRSDVFSLAVVLWEMAAGKPMITRDDPGLAMRALRDGKFDPIDRVVPNMPRALSNAIAWALEIDRDRRATAADLAQALESYIKSSPELATPLQLSSWLTSNFPNGAEDDDEPLPKAPGTAVGPPTTDEGVLAQTPQVELTREPSPSKRTRGNAPHASRAGVIATPTDDTRHYIGPRDDSSEFSRTEVFEPSDPNELDETTRRELHDAANLIAGARRERRKPNAKNQAGNRATPSAGVPAPLPVAVAPVPQLQPPQTDRPRRGPVPPRDVPLPAPLAASSRRREVETAAVAPLPRGHAPAPPQARPLRLWPIALAAAALLGIGILAITTTTSRSRRTNATIDAAGPVAAAVDAASIAPAPADAPTLIEIEMPVVDAPPADAAELPEVVPPPNVAILEVSTEPPDSLVTVGDRTGTAPVRFELDPGEHLIVAEHAGYLRTESKHEAALGKVTRLTISLDILPVDGQPFGLLSLRAKPDAQVFEGNRSLGKTPLDIELPAGTHRMVFRAAGHQPLVREIDVRKSRKAKLVEVELTPVAP